MLKQGYSFNGYRVAVRRGVLWKSVARVSPAGNELWSVEYCRLVLVMGQAVSSSSLAVVCTREVRCQCLMSEVAESAADSVETVVPLLVSNA